MLKDQDRIFTNLYGMGDRSLAGAQKRGHWDGTGDIIGRGRDKIIEQVKASGLRWLHTESASFYSLVADLVTIPTIVISTGAGITALKETCGGAITIVVGALNLLAAFIVTMNRYYAPGTF